MATACLCRQTLTRKRYAIGSTPLQKIVKRGKDLCDAGGMLKGLRRSARSLLNQRVIGIVLGLLGCGIDRVPPQDEQRVAAV